MPSLTETAALAALSKGRVAPVYLLVGDDEVGKRRLIEGLEALVEPDLRGLNVQRLHANEHPLVAILASARTLPLLGDRRVVIALRCEVFLRPSRKGSSTADDEEPGDRFAEQAEGEALSGALAELAAYLDSPLPETVLVLVASDITRTTRIGKHLLKAATVIEFWGLKTERQARGRALEQARRAGERFVRERVREAGLRTQPGAIEPLLEHAGTNISVLRNDLDRLILFCAGRAEITSQDVARVVSGAALVDAWAIVNAIERKDTAQALRQLAQQLGEGTSPHQIVGQLRWFASEKMVLFAPQRVEPAIEALFRTDAALKSSGGDPQILLERLVVDLCEGGRQAAGGIRRRD